MENSKELYKFPLSYIWSSTSYCVPTNDGGLIYIGNKSINYIGPIKSKSKPPSIDTLNTRQNLICIDVDPGWGKPSPSSNVEAKYVAVLAMDRTVQIWNFSSRKAVYGHKVHRVEVNNVDDGFNANNSNVLMRFMKNRNVLSIDRVNIVNYCIASNTYYLFKNFLPKRLEHYTALECSPYNDEVFAIGTQKGTIYLCNMQKGTVLYTLKGHEQSISSMKFSHFERIEKPGVNKSEKENSPKQKQETSVVEKEKAIECKVSEMQYRDFAEPCDDFVDIYEYDYNEIEFGATVENKDEKKCDFVGIEKPLATDGFDFSEECCNLKDDIEQSKIAEASQNFEMNEVSLEDCKKSDIQCNTSPTCSEKDEPLGSSLELINNKNSNDGDADGDGQIENDNDVDGDFLEDADIKLEVKCQADIHSSPLDVDLMKDAVKTESFPNDKEEDKDFVKDKTNEENKESVRDIVLVSVCNDGKVTVWTTATGAHSDSVNLRSQTAAAKNKIFPHVSFLNQHTLLVTSRCGKMFCFKIQAVHNHDESPTYSLHILKKQFKTNSIAQFATSLENLIWIMSTSRIITLENVETNDVLAKFGCVSSNITCIAANPEDMNKIALSLADRRIGILDLSKLGPTEISIENIIASSDAGILCLAWSSDGNKLIYGTAEGKVAIINYGAGSASKKNIFVLDPVCGKDVYKVEWHNSDIFVLCNYQIAVYSDDMKQKTGRVVKKINNVTTFAVQGPYLFAGLKNGSFQVYKRQGSKFDFVYLHQINVGSRYVCDIAFSYADSNLFAVICNCNTVAIFKFDRVEEKCEKLKTFTASNNSRSACSTLRWSFTDPKVFLTTGQDGSVRLWNLDTAEEKPFFVRFFPFPLLSGMFSPSDENIIMCSGKSGSLAMFDIRAAGNMATKPKKNVDTINNILWGSEAFKCQQLSSTEKRRLKRMKEVVQVSDTNLELETIDDLKENLGVLREVNDSVDLVNKQMKNIKLVGEPNTLTEDLNISLKPVDFHYKKIPSSILVLINKELNRDTLAKILQALNAIRNNDTGLELVLTSKLFGSKSDAQMLIQEELDNHRQSATKGVQHLFLPLVGFSLKEEILSATAAKKLNEWLVSLAPSISYQFWKQTAEAYAYQLEEQGYCIQASCYMIALHKYTDAIQMLMNGKLFKEALLLGKIYLLDEDPLRKQIFDTWIEYLNSTGNFYGAALIHVLIKDFETAHNFLSRIFNKNAEVQRILDELQSMMDKHDQIDT